MTEEAKPLALGALRAVYTAVFKIHGLTNLPGKIVLLEPQGEHKIESFLTTDVAEIVDGYAARTGMANLALDGFGGPPKHADKELDERIALYIDEEHTRTAAKVGSGIYLVIKAEKPIDQYEADQSATNLRMLIDVFPAGYFSGVTKDTADAIVTAIAISIPDNASKYIEKLLEFVAGFDLDGEKVTLLNFSANATLSLASQAPAEFVEQVKQNVPILVSHEHITTPVKLLSESIRNNSAPLYSYICAWASLEIFIQKVFAYHQLSTGIMPNNLAERFKAVSAFVGVGKFDEEFSQFKGLKKARDNFYHNPTDTPPVETLRAFSVKYLRLYLKRLGESASVAFSATPAP